MARNQGIQRKNWLPPKSKDGGILKKQLSRETQKSGMADHVCKKKVVINSCGMKSRQQMENNTGGLKESVHIRH